MHKTYEDAKNHGDAPWSNLVRETKTFYMFNDGYPVTEGHVLFVPKENTINSINTCMAAANLHGHHSVRMGKCDGFNLGINYGEAAGQTVMYPHIHLIPRRKGDMENPRGGVRHVIPDKANY